LIERLKADLIAKVGNLFYRIAENSEKAISEALAEVIIAAYMLGKRLGIDFAVLDEAIGTQVSQANKKNQEIEKWFGDYSEFQRYLRQKR
jgi:phenylpyruvate tautomerase PptA (4-oxalocrotonate tautomerase family)